MTKTRHVKIVARLVIVNTTAQNNVTLLLTSSAARAVMLVTCLEIVLTDSVVLTGVMMVLPCLVVDPLAALVLATLLTTRWR